MNSLSYIIIDIFCAIQLAVLTYACIFEITFKAKHHKWFVYLTASIILALLCDALAFGLTALHPPIAVLRIINGYTFWGGFLTSALFTQFLYDFINTKSPISPKPFFAVEAFQLLGMVIALFFSFSDDLYYYLDYTYTPGKFYGYYIILSLASVFVIFFLIIGFRKRIKTHDMVAMCSYAVAPLIALISNYFLPEFSLTYPATSVSITLLYVMLHSQQEELAQFHSKTDRLTGLLNRHSYEEKLSTMTTSGKIGVMFCDINGLKYTNDHFGHAAGDELMLKLAEALKSTFRASDTYRISGDEFVVILENISFVELKKREAMLLEHINSHEYPLAAVGTAYGENEKISVLVTMAENCMYTNKAEFYVHYPQYKTRVTQE